MTTLTKLLATASGAMPATTHARDTDRDAKHDAGHNARRRSEQMLTTTVNTIVITAMTTTVPTAPGLSAFITIFRLVGNATSTRAVARSPGEVTSRPDSLTSGPPSNSSTEVHWAAVCESGQWEFCVVNCTSA